MLMHLLNAMSVSKIMKMSNKEGYRPSEASDVSQSPRSNDEAVVVDTLHNLEERAQSIAPGRTESEMQQDTNSAKMKQALNEFMDPRS